MAHERLSVVETKTSTVGRVRIGRLPACACVALAPSPTPALAISAIPCGLVPGGGACERLEYRGKANGSAGTITRPRSPSAVLGSTGGGAQANRSPES
eukprot:679301-Pleurochrysis_carterae.AAC.2